MDTEVSFPDAAQVQKRNRVLLRRATIIPFGVGAAAMIAASALVYVGPLNSAAVVLVRVLTITFGIAVLVLVIEALRTTARTRWLNLLAVAVLLLAFSGFAILSIGFLTLPVALALLLLSLGKLSWRSRTSSAG